MFALPMCRRAMLEEGDSLDASPLLVTGQILESLGSVGEAAVSDGFTFSFTINIALPRMILS